MFASTFFSSSVAGALSSSTDHSSFVTPTSCLRNPLQIARAHCVGLVLSPISTSILSTADGPTLLSMALRLLRPTLPCRYLHFPWILALMSRQWHIPNHLLSATSDGLLSRSKPSRIGAVPILLSQKKPATLYPEVEPSAICLYCPNRKPRRLFLSQSRP